MGYDRIAYFEGTGGETTLISGDKESSHVVYGFDFKTFLGKLGFKTDIVIDRQDVAEAAQYSSRIEATIKDLPEITKTEIIPGHRLALYEFVEIKPPINDQTMLVLNAYFETHCQPNDAGIILDYRSGAVKVTGGF